MAPSEISRKVPVIALWTLASAAVAAIAYRTGVEKGAAGDSGRGDGVATVDVRWGADEDIERVLSFWFDGSSHDNHRTKWFAQVWSVDRLPVVRCVLHEAVRQYKQFLQ